MPATASPTRAQQEGARDRRRKSSVHPDQQAGAPALPKLEGTLQRTVGNLALQRMARVEPAVAVDGGLEQELNRQRAGGAPLAPDVRAFMEARLGADLGGVQVHADASAARLNDQVQAEAFTQGPDIFFGQGKYQPHSPAGQQLLAHELVHTVQQGAAPAGVIQRKGKQALPTKTVPLVVVRVTDGKSAPQLDPMAFVTEADKVYEPAGIQFGIIRVETVDIKDVISDPDLVEKSRSSYWNKQKQEKFGSLKGQERAQAEMSFEDKTVQPYVDRWVQAIAAHSTRYDKGIIKCYFVPGHAFADMRGFTIRYKLDDVSGKEENPALKGEGSVVTVNTGFETPKDLPKKLQHSLGHTLAHEMGHALLDEGGHVPSYDKAKGGVKNIMASGSERTHHHMTGAQVGKMRGSSYAKDAGTKAPLPSLADFVKQTGGARGRNRVLAIDRALENYNRIEAFAQMPERLKLISHITHLCRDYLGLGEKSTSSERRAGVQTLLYTAHQLLTELQRGTSDKVDPANTPLHNAAKNGLLSKVQEEIKNKSDLDARNAFGDTPLTMAIRGGGAAWVQIVDELLKAGADPNRGPYGFYAFDIAKAANRQAMLDLIVKAKGRSAINGATLAPDAVKDASTPEVLSWATLSDNLETQARLRQAYEELYAQDEFKAIMDIARLKVIGPPQSDIGAVRIYAISTTDAGWLNAGGTPAGAFQPETKGLIIGSKMSMEDMKGTLIHEMTHMAVSVIFENDVMPFSPQELDALKKTGKLEGILKQYIEAIRGDTSSKKRKGAEAEIYRTVVQRVYGGTKEDVGYANVGEQLTGEAKGMSTSMLQEFVVGIPQAISQFGGKKVQQVSPGLYSFFMETFNKAAQEWLKKEKAKPQPTTTVTAPTVTAPVVTQPVVPQPVVPQPVVTQPVVTQPVVTPPEKKPSGGGQQNGTGPAKPPAPAPTFFGDLSSPNPFLYFRDNSRGGFNLRVDSVAPDAPWAQVDQFCAYMASYWLSTNGATNQLKFAQMPKPVQENAAITLKGWGAKGLAEQVKYARAQIKGGEVKKETVAKNITNAVYTHGVRIWFGTDIHAEAAVVQPDGSYKVYDPNTGATTIQTKEQFAAYINKANTFVVAWKV